MWTFLLIIAAIALWQSPSLRRSVARLIHPDKQAAPASQGRTSASSEPAPDASRE